MSKENVSLQKLMYMIVYDTLVESFENISRKKRSWNNLCLREGGKSMCVWLLKSEDLWNGEMMSPFTLYREQEKSGIYPALNFKEKCCPLDQDLTVGCQRHSAAWNN